MVIKIVKVKCLLKRSEKETPMSVASNLQKNNKQLALGNNMNIVKLKGGFMC